MSTSKDAHLALYFGGVLEEFCSRNDRMARAVQSHPLMHGHDRNGQATAHFASGRRAGFCRAGAFAVRGGQAGRRGEARRRPRGVQAGTGDGDFDLIISDYHLPSFTGSGGDGDGEEKVVRTRRSSWFPARLASRRRLKASRRARRIMCSNSIRNGCRPPCAAPCKEAGERAKLREAEAELARREKYFRTLTENSLDILCVIGPRGELRLHQPVHQKRAGLRAGGNARAKTCSRAFMPRICRSAQEAFQQALEHPERTVKIQFRYKNQDGEWRRLEACRQEPAGRPGNQRHRRQLPRRD